MKLTRIKQEVLISKQLFIKSNCIRFTYQGLKTIIITIMWISVCIYGLHWLTKLSAHKTKLQRLVNQTYVLNLVFESSVRTKLKKHKLDTNLIYLTHIHHSQIFIKPSFAKRSHGKMSVGRKYHTAKSLTEKNPHGDVSSRQNILKARCP